MVQLTPSMLLGSRRKRSLFAHVVETVGEKIVSGEFAPGEQLPNEARLGAEFSASRSVIREAVKSLAGKGLLESRTRTGISVLPPERWNLLDTDVLEWRYSAMNPAAFFAELFEIRQMIEPAASALAATRRTSEDLSTIEAEFEAMRNHSAPTMDAIAADLAFHRGILSAAHNPMLLQMGNVIADGLLVSYRISKDAFNLFLDDHKAVLDAIRVQDAAAAREAMNELLTGTSRFLKQRHSGV
jgi:DNA-binding FadR family transcriptional regulator